MGLQAESLIPGRGAAWCRSTPKKRGGGGWHAHRAGRGLDPKRDTNALHPGTVGALAEDLLQPPPRWKPRWGPVELAPKPQKGAEAQPLPAPKFLLAVCQFPSVGLERTWDGGQPPSMQRCLRAKLLDPKSTFGYWFGTGSGWCWSIGGLCPGAFPVCTSEGPDCLLPVSLSRSRLRAVALDQGPRKCPVLLPRTLRIHCWRASMPARVGVGWVSYRTFQDPLPRG